MVKEDRSRCSHVARVPYIQLGDYSDWPATAQHNTHTPLRFDSSISVQPVLLPFWVLTAQALHPHIP